MNNNVVKNKVKKRVALNHLEQINILMIPTGALGI